MLQVSSSSKYYREDSLFSDQMSNVNKHTTSDLTSNPASKFSSITNCRSFSTRFLGKVCFQSRPFFPEMIRRLFS